VLKTTQLQGAGVSTLTLEGRVPILEHSALLEELAERCDQSGTMCALRFFLESSSSSSKIPILFLLLYPGASPHNLCCDDVHAAVLIYEHRFLGLPLGVFSSDGYNDFRTIIAPEHERRAVAILIAKLLLENDAHIVKISAEGSFEPAESITAQLEGANAFWAQQEREYRYVFPLGATFEETLAKFGKSTRFNLRYYRRRLSRRMHCEVVADARGQLAHKELKSLNANSLNPLPFQEFEKLYQNLSCLPHGFLFGVREVGGGWIGLVGGWRQGTTTVLHWQLNVRGYEKDSLVNVVRSYFLEHIVQQGARKLVIYGGTIHSMSHSFVVSPAFDLAVRRRTLRSALLRLCMKMQLRLSPDQPKDGALKLLTDNTVKWSYLPALPLKLASRKRRAA